MEEEIKNRCEGWVRREGAFTLGPVGWVQCKNKGVVILTFKYPETKKQTLPACSKCWRKCIDDERIKIISVIPIIDGEKNGKE